MPPKEDNRTTFSDLMNQLDKQIRESVSRADLEQVLRAVAEIVREAQQKLEEKTAQNGDEMKAETERLGKEAAAMESRLRELIAKGDGATRAELDQLRTELLTDISAVESMIETFDDSEIQEKIAAAEQQIEDVRKQIPEQFDATELEETIESMKKEVEELKKRPVGSGGVRRVFQPHIEDLSGDTDGATKTFYLTREPLRTDTALVWGSDFPIILRPTTDFTLNGKTLTLTDEVDAPTSGATLLIQYYA